MKPASFIAFTLLASACAAGSGLGGADGGGSGGPRGGGGSHADRVEWHPMPYEASSIQVLESLPPQFVLVFSCEMPTPGYRFEVDDVEVDAEQGRIVARVSELSPTGMVAQVITRTELRLNVGSVPAGRYAVEIRSRRGDKGDYRPAGAAVIVASGKPGRR